MSLFLAILVVPLLWIYVKVNQLFKKKPTQLPTLDVTKNWGRASGENVVDSEKIEAFAVEFDKHESHLIDSLRNALDQGSVRAAEPLDGIGFEYGINSTGLKHFLDYWAHNYLLRWSERQAFLNSFPQFTTEVQGYEFSGPYFEHYNY